MRRLLGRLWRDERGVSLAVIALTMTTLLSLLAFSLDLGLLYTARVEAQRAADAAALAGASAFLNYPPTRLRAAQAEAEERARDYASLNTIRGVPIDPVQEVDFPSGGECERCVHVTVRRDSVPLWFAPLLGVTTRSVTATAIANAVRASDADCVSPLSFQYETVWESADYWESLHGEVVPIGPQGSSATYEYVFADETVVESSWIDEPEECHSQRLSIGQTIPAGDAPLNNDWARKLADEPTSWDDIGDGQGWNSPRVITVMLHQSDDYNPSAITIKDFLLFFVESADPDNQTVHGRFLAYASGMGQGQSDTMLSLRLTR